MMKNEEEKLGLSDDGQTFTVEISWRRLTIFEQIANWFRDLLKR